MKFILFSTILFINLLCEVGANREFVEGVVIYTFSKYGSFNCETESKILIKHQEYDFFDSRYLNAILISLNKNLERTIGNDSLFRYFIFESDSTNDLNYSSYKKSLENGTLISSSEIYTKHNNNELYIAFNFVGEVIRYKKIPLEDEKKNYKNDDCCPRKTMINKNEYFILSEAIELKQLNKEQILKLGFSKSHKKQIDVFICE